MQHTKAANGTLLKTDATGISIDWSVPGATELVLEALSDQLRAYMDTSTACAQTAQATRQLGMARKRLDERHADREARGVRGTNTP